MYINTETFEYPISDVEIRSRHKDTSFPEHFESWGDYHRVYEAPEPDYDGATQTVVQDTPVFKDGKWFQAWKIINLSAQEISDKNDLAYRNASESIRNERNSLLRDCDWTQLPDSTADKATWADYRSQLRDITKQQGFPWNVVWPARPV